MERYSNVPWEVWLVLAVLVLINSALLFLVQWLNRQDNKHVNQRNALDEKLRALREKYEAQEDRHRQEQTNLMVDSIRAMGYRLDGPIVVSTFNAFMSRFNRRKKPPAA